MSGPSERDEIAADREALAEVVGGHLPQSRGAGRWPGCFSHPRVEDWTPDHLADAVLASDWLAERDRRTAAKTLASVGRKAERLRDPNPMNGDTRNLMLTKVLNLIVAEGNAEADAIRDAILDEQAAMRAERNARYERLEAENRARREPQ